MPESQKTNSLPDHQAPDSLWVRCTPLVIRGAVYVFALYNFSYTTADPDLWGHIKFGETIWTQQAIPKTDLFSYTAEGRPWINHEWLTEVLFFLLYHTLGSTGLLGFKLLVGLGVIHLLSSLVLGKSRSLPLYILYALCFYLMIPILMPGFMTRPHLMTLLCLTILVYLLKKYISGNSRVLAGAPLLMLVWVNSHGGVVAGIGIFGAFVFIDAVQKLLQKEKPDTRLFFWFGVSLLAVFANPYGYQLWLFFQQSLGVPRPISEWRAIPLWDTSFWQYKLLALLFIGAWVARAPKRWAEVTIIALALIYGFKHQRHSVLAVIVLIPFLVPRLDEWITELNLRRRLAARSFSLHFYLAANFVMFIFIGLQLFSILSRYQLNNYKILVDPRLYPSHLARFMRDNGINGNIATPFDWGEYFIWKLPQSKVSIDGRFRTVYPENIIELNRRFTKGLPGGKFLLALYPTDLIVTRNADGTDRSMENEADWLKIYSDPISSLYARKTRTALLEKHLNGKLVHTDAPVSVEFP